MVVYDCLKCGYKNGPFAQTGQQTEVKPLSCSNCQSKAPFQINVQETVYRNYQKITLQESPGTVPAGRLPRSKEVVLLDDLIDEVRDGSPSGSFSLPGSLFLAPPSCTHAWRALPVSSDSPWNRLQRCLKVARCLPGQVRPGDEIHVAGIYTHTYDASLNVKNGFPVFNTVIEANNVIKKTDQFAFYKLTDADKHIIKKVGHTSLTCRWRPLSVDESQSLPGKFLAKLLRPSNPAALFPTALQYSIYRRELCCFSRPPAALFVSRHRRPYLRLHCSFDIRT